MYDTINFWLGAEQVDDVYCVVQYLADVEQRNDINGSVSYAGKLGDYSVICKPNGIAMYGSLAKFYLHSNMATLTRATAQEAIEKMSDMLHLDMRQAIVRRLDVSTVMPTKRPPAEYYNRLGDKRYFTRLQATPNTLYYNTQRQQLAFYDKVKEHRAKGVQVPLPLADCQYVLRYELRYLKKVQSQLGVVDGATLYNPKFYREMVTRWRDAYISINKISRNNNVMMEIKKAKDVKDLVLLRALQAMPADFIDGIMVELKAQHALPSARDYTRAKGYIKDVLEKATADKHDDELLTELDTTIKDMAKYAR